MSACAPRAPTGEIGHVEPEKVGATAHRANRGRRFLAPRLGDVAEHHVRPRRGERVGRGAPDARRRSRHDGRPAIQSHGITSSKATE
jgi:hypothetical protein